jgi:glutaredoxin 3
MLAPMFGSSVAPRARRLAAPCALALLFAACGNPVPGTATGASDDSPAASTPQKPASPAAEAGRPVAPPFAVRGELDGLLLVWFDQQGLHTAKRRSDIPEARRAHVRVESLSVAPSQRLDPEHVYVADLRAAGADGSYSVRSHSRAWFDAQVDGARPAAEASAHQADTGVTIYSASWCGVCRAAKAYFRSRNVPFVEKDVEKDADANNEMQRKAHAAGKRPTGVPVIDFHGHLMLGFDQATLDRLIEQYTPI